MASEDKSHDLVGVETDDVKEIRVQTDIAYTMCEESAIERFPSISPDTILKQCCRIKDMKRDGADLEEIFHELDGDVTYILHSGYSRSETNQMA